MVDSGVDNGIWIRPGAGDETPIWGIRGGVQVGIWPGSVEGAGKGGPRGLLRVGYPMIDGGKAIGRINFIAIEPIVGGRRGYSELERSETDGKAGKVFWVEEAVETDECLSVVVHVEKFDNGAAPMVRMEFRADRPGEVSLTTMSERDGARMDCCVLTATMGNYGRLREIHLRDEVVAPSSLWPDFKGMEFTDDKYFPSSRFAVMPDGDLVVCATTNEIDLKSAPVDPQSPGWAYRGDFPLTQYWRVPKAEAGERDLRARVNGRRVYWAAHAPIPGGLAYENFDLTAPFRDGEKFIFGVTRRSPEEVGRGVI